MHLSPKSEKKLYKGKITTVQQNDILYFTYVIKPKKVSQFKSLHSVYNNRFENDFLESVSCLDWVQFIEL